MTNVTISPASLGMKILMRHFYMIIFKHCEFCPKQKWLREKVNIFWLSSPQKYLFCLDKQYGLTYVVILSKMGLSDGVSACWPLIGTTTFAAAAIAIQLATLIASSLPEDDHRFRTHSIKVWMLVAILTDRII